MAKFKFGAPPKTFTRIIKFKTVDGASEEFSVTFRYRSRDEFGEFFDEMTAGAKARGVKTRNGEEYTMADIMSATNGDHGKYLIRALESWEFEDELNEANALRLANEFPAAASAIMDTYREACLEGKLGN